ncbi:glycerol-3-phosphate 1-O-acyltransferase PlsY [Desulfitobacterium sp. LBE]|uniref:glycerol-3-phosphate 1-O-acyltransferase PlsY n=1 Tax=Desulfitobacterium sp. LBE TaxID=884086 RepID=UPI00155A742F|nr:glycerol-3-phosphate 1-O-acyltransferase PlsY [Desulfitobacterium sp. LBE]
MKLASKEAGMIDLFMILGAYLLGGMSTGYYLVKLWRQEDVRNQGSGATGATNAGRVLGKKGFLLTLMGDALKGALAPALSMLFNLSLTTLMLCLIAVVAGHIWPLQLGLRGGKGVAPALGGILVVDPMLASAAAGVFLFVLALTRQFTLSGLAAILGAPILSLIMARPFEQSAGLAVLAIFILLAHRKNIREMLNKSSQRRR